MLLTQYALNIPASFEAGLQPSQWNTKVPSPVAKAFALAVKLVLLCVFVGRALSVGRSGDRGCQGALRAPALVFDAQPDGVEADARFFSPSGNRLGLAVKCQEKVATPVSVLRFACRPSAIARFVTSAVVNSVNGKASARTAAHISDEVFKAVPALANLNSASAVVGKRPVLRVIAALKHRVPNLVFRNFGKPVRGATVLGRATVAHLHLALLFGVAKLAAFADSLFAALALAKPKLLMLQAFWRCSRANHFPLPKTLARQVNSCTHVFLLDGRYMAILPQERM